MGGKGDAPAPPDFTPIAAASQQSAQLSYQLGQDQLAWSKEQFQKTSSLTDQVVQSALDQQAQVTDTAKQQAAFGAQQQARYQSEFQPLEDQLVADAENYSSGARKDLEMGRAGAQVATQFNTARNAAASNLESFGVDPTSTRYASLVYGTYPAQAAAVAGAANQAQEQVEAQGRALRSEAINVGRGYPGQIAQTYGTALNANATALNAGSSAENSSLANVSSGANTMGTPTQWQSLGNQAVGIWGNTLQMGYQDALSQYQANQNSSSGWGSALGLIGGIASALPAGTFAAGGAVTPAIPLGQDPAAQGPGLPNASVPISASPTHGAAIDDVNARLSPGEFVMPKDVVSWFGQEKLQKMIQQGREAAMKAVAKPSVGPALPGPVQFASQGAQAPALAGA